MRGAPVVSVIILALCVSLCGAANPLEGIFSAENLKRATVKGVEVRPGDQPDTVVLRFPGEAEPAELAIPVPEAARDWTRYGTFTFEFLSDSTLRWQIGIRNRAGRVFGYRVQPYKGVRAKAAITSAFLQREFMNNRAFKAHWLSNWGNHIDLTEVESLVIRVEPNCPMTLRLGPVRLETGTVSDEFYLDKPVVDEFGQWISDDWPGKVRSLEELRAAWKKEDAELARKEDFGFCRYGGWRESKERATGFFRTAQIDGRWWLVDPDGHLFFSIGMDCVRYRDPSPMMPGREKLFVRLPPGTGDTVDFYAANARLRYGEENFVENWKAKISERLRAWGFNTVANWSDSALHVNPSMPFVTNVRVGRSKKNWVGFPDVYSEEFVKSAEEDAARQCRPFRDEPMLIGYFIGNEPRWPGRNLIERILADPEESATRSFARKFLAEKGDTPGSREALLETISRHYFKVTVDAIRKADPNHMVLGIRWAGSAPEPVLRANDVFDVFSINIYRFEPPADQIRRIYELVRKPVMIGEFHFGAPERGLAPSLVMVKNQTERGAAYQYYVERAAAQPVIIGTHYFQLCDQPVTGRFDGENYNLGFLNVVDLPYAELVRFAKETHRRVHAVHAGKIEPTRRMAQVR
ncbi:MAG TPA: hypothetical protein PLA43_02015 [Bryobacteraceae bacterium]|nr:hypothetical protein [Bryobacteraceae bacterium]HOQ44385.1 hypothetical protein [Bryobacteraceae bacterium]HPU70704.1 hypothetical protein [Bryobacteraceae bacterium]